MGVYTKNRAFRLPTPETPLPLAKLVPMLCLEDIDEAMFWEQGSAAGADGLVLWGYEPSDEDQQAFQEYWANDFCPLFSARATAQTKMATTA